MNDEKINLLKKAMGEDGPSPAINRPNLQGGKLDLGTGRSSLESGNRFQKEGFSNDPKNVKDPKGKNKQVLKGNAKSKRR